MAKSVLDIGNCDMDHGSISQLLESHFDVKITRTHAMSDALAALQNGPFDLVLVNRLMDRDGASGLDIIKHIQGDSDLAQVPVMMITNFAEHQDSAVAEGAEPGFGKSALGDAATVDVLRPFLG